MPIILNLAVCWFWQSKKFMVCRDQDMDQIVDEPRSRLGRKGRVGLTIGYILKTLERGWISCVK